MTSVTVRPFLGLLMTAAIGLLPMVPPEHVHEVEDHGHLELVVHRHLQGHNAAGLGHSGVVDHDDAPIATLEQDYIVPSCVHLEADVPMDAVSLAPTPRELRLPFAAFVERLIHAPPRGPTLDRGPPFALASQIQA